ncbi:MAG: 6-phosphofructokinase [Dehalococcoidia bacterium]
MKRIGILTSGGDAPGMNACIRAAVRAARAHDIEILGIRRGYAGLIRGEIERLDRKAVANIIHQGGTILGTARSSEFMAPEGRALAIKNLEKEAIEGLILIGGDGTFRGGSDLSQECGVGIIGVPGTIDNDIYGSDYTIGFDSAVNCALNAIDRIRDTALSHERLFFVEVMGRRTGFIALESGMAGGAEELLIPELPFGVDDLCSHLERSFKGEKRSAIVVVAESGKPGDSFRIAREVREKTGFDSRVCVLGHLQRGGSPTARDRVLAGKLGVAAVSALVEGKSGCMVGEVNWRVAYTPLRDTWDKKKDLNADLVGMRELLCE